MTAAKRPLSPDAGAESPLADHPSKKVREYEDGKRGSMYNKVATAENAAAVDADPLLPKLLKAVEDTSVSDRKPEGECVVYWMRLEDLRIVDNRAISRASQHAKKENIPLVALFIISPQDLDAHDRGPRRIDFMLRNLSILKSDLNDLNIPLVTITHRPRHDVPNKVISLLREWGADSLYANISYEVDELRRDITTCHLGRDEGITCFFIQDKLIVNPGILSTKEGKQYSVYSPWQRQWLDKLNKNLDWIAEVPKPAANDSFVRTGGVISRLFDFPVPLYVDGFQCDDRDKMKEYWPAGIEAASQTLKRFLDTRARSEQIGEVSPISAGAESSTTESRVRKYAEGRNHVDKDTSSRLSPYLASGVISARECIRGIMNLSKAGKRLEGGRDTGVGMWVQEIAWRDFYNHVMVAFPRVSMGRPFNEKYANVKWEVNEEHLQKWKDGRTGVPIVDAAMRQLNAFGWMHNRCRMIVAMYLTKDLMLDWRLGEKYFMQQLIDGDLASNNGGWQWSASTGTDPQPYFRIFNPVMQSEKADPDGHYIRRYVTELQSLKGKTIHNPSGDAANAHRYPTPVIEHNFARERALRRYKNPGIN